MPPPIPSHLPHRLVHAHYLLNLVLLLPVPLILLSTLPAERHVDRSEYAAHVAYSVPVAGMPLMVRARSHGCLETRVTVLFAMMKLYNFGALLFMQRWTGAGIYFLIWTAVSALFPRPRYQGPSNLDEISQHDLDLSVLGVPPDLPGPSDLADLSSSEVESLVDRIRRETVVRKEAVKGKKAVVLPWWKGERGCWDVEVLVSRVSTLYPPKDVSFYLVDLARYPSVGADLDLSTGQVGPRSGLPCVILYADGKEVLRLPPPPAEPEQERKPDPPQDRDGGSQDEQEGEEEVKKTGKWEWNEDAIIEAVEKLKKVKGHFAVF